MLKTKISLWFQSKRNDIMGLKKKKKSVLQRQKDLDLKFNSPFPFPLSNEFQN